VYKVSRAELLRRKGVSGSLRHFRYGIELYKVCQTYQHADPELREHILIVQGVSLKNKQQVEALRRIWDTLSDDLQIHQGSVLALLNAKLQSAIKVITSLNALPQDEPTLKSLTLHSGNTKKLKYALYGKRQVEAVVKDLEEWQARYDPSWFLLARMADPKLDHVLVRNIEQAIVRDLREAHRLNDEQAVGKKSVFLPADYLTVQGKRILYTSVSLAEADLGHVVVDTLPLAIGNEQSALSGARDLARILACVQPELFGLLSCAGVLPVRNATPVSGISPSSRPDVQFIFKFPSNGEAPRSPRDVLANSISQSPLDNRVQVAKLLGRSIAYLHSVKIVHKNISPETILLFRNSRTQLDTPFLVGFQQFRHADGVTQRIGDSSWYKNIYRHPGRQGQHPEDAYIMQHDIYSLGVCMLEIGLGYSFVHYAGSHTTPSPQLDIDEDLKNKDERQRSRSIKAKLVKMACTLLPARMGRAYTRVVVSCLTCLDADNEDFGKPKEFEDDSQSFQRCSALELVDHNRRVLLRRLVARSSI